MSQEPEREDGFRWGRAAVIALAIVVAVYVLFTWVFPWVTEMGLNPALEQ